MTPKPLVLIVIPTLNGLVTVELMRMVCHAMALNSDPDAPFRFDYRTLKGCRPFEYARNLLMQKALETDADWIWFMDADMLPTDSWVLLLDELAKGRADMLTGLFATAHCAEDGSVGLKLLAFRKSASGVGFDAIIPEEPIEEIDAAGTGCLLISGRVLRDTRMRPHFPNDTERPGWFVCEYGTDGKMDMGEDLEFCWRARQLGYRMVLVRDAVFGHPVTFDAIDVAKMLQRSAASAAA